MRTNILGTRIDAWPELKIFVTSSKGIEGLDEGIIIIKEDEEGLLSVKVEGNIDLELNEIQKAYARAE